MPTIAAALYDLFNEHDLPVEDALTRHFTAGYRQSTDGSWIDRAGFAAQVAQLRLVIDHVDIRVLDELSNGPAYAERHVITAAQRDGTTSCQEVFLFGEIAKDGRFASLEELVRPLTGC